MKNEKIAILFDFRQSNDVINVTIKRGDFEQVGVFCLQIFFLAYSYN